MKIPVHDSVHDMFLCLHIVCLNISIIRSSAPVEAEEKSDSLQ